jgi:uncharacterized membrane protein
MERTRTLAVATSAVAILTTLGLGTTSPGQADSQTPDAGQRIKPYGYLQDRGGGFTRIAVPGARVGTGATDVNNRGQIVGGYDDALPLNQQGYLRRRGGAVIRLQFPGSGYTEPAGINDRGQVVGNYGEDEAAGTPRSFLWEDGRFTRIKIPGSVADGAFDINDREQIVGLYVDRKQLLRGFLLDRRDRFTRIEPPGAVVTYATGINERGTIVGPYIDRSGTLRGFVRTPGGKYRTVDYPGSAASGLVRVNDRGQILGRYSEVGTLPSGDLIEPRNFILDDGVFRDLEDPPFAKREALAYGLNDRGQVVGSVDLSAAAGGAASGRSIVPTAAIAPGVVTSRRVASPNGERRRR